ncbi:MAG: BatD family protein [Pseudomonadota bacterium]
MTRTSTFYKFIIFIAMFSILAKAQASGTASVQAIVEKDTVSLGEPFRLDISVNGADKSENPLVDVIKDFSVESLGGRSNSSTSISIINNKVDRIETKGYVYSYQLTPLKKGRMIIPSIPVSVDGQTLQTQPITIIVDQPETTEDFHLTVEFSKKEFYVNEPVIMKVIWYVGKEVEQFSFNLPILNMEGFEFVNPPPDQNATSQYFTLTMGQDQVIAKKELGQYQGRDYTTLSFTKALFAKEDGTFHIPDATVACKAFIGYSKKERRGSPFDDFFDDSFFGFGKNKVFKNFVAYSESATLTVLPLPSDSQPEKFSGLVGNYQIEASANPVEINVGDPITLTISISGPEYLNNIELPSLKDDPELSALFTIPKEMAAGEIKGGKKVFTQTLRAKSDSVKEIPPIRFYYFDPDQKKYAISESKPIPITVKPTRIVTAEDAEGKDAQQPALKNELEGWAQGIEYNYEGPDVMEDQKFSIANVFRSPEWILAGLLPFLGWLILYISVSIYRARHANPDAFKSKKAFSIFKKEIDRFGGSGHPDANAYAQLLDAVRTYIGNKWNFNGAALTLKDVEGILKEKGVYEQRVCKGITTLFNVCEQGRYGGEAGTEMSFQELVKTSLATIKEIEAK